MNIAKKIKQIVKGGTKETFGTEPNDPWSTKAGITESASLDRYLKSRGIEPKFLSKDTKVAHAKSNEFKKWRRDHMFEQVFTHTPTQAKEHLLKKKARHGQEIKTEEVDAKDTITLDIPFMIRVLEYAREDAKDDMALHKVVEKLIEIRNKGTLTMDDYDFVTKIKESYELDESALERFRAAAAQREKEAEQRRKEMETRHAAGKEDMKGAIDRLAKTLNKEDMYQDSQAATQTCFDGANTPDNTEPQMPGLKKREMSKSARIIKSLYKKKGVVKEELYDHEKEDKSVESYGKQPKLKEVDKTKKDDKSPKAAAVLSGGTTLTGEPRDTLEIDPEMKRPIRFDGKKEEKR